MDDTGGDDKNPIVRWITIAAAVMTIVTGFIVLGEHMQQKVPDATAATSPVAAAMTPAPASTPIPASNLAPVPVASPTTNCNTVDSGFILPDSSQRLLQLSEIIGLGAAKLRIARNEIFARHGYRFKSDLKYYFACKPWYQASRDNVNGQLSDLEKQNIELIRRAERG
jgi:hypothetical protein